jgi:hypothetical protein
MTSFPPAEAKTRKRIERTMLDIDMAWARRTVGASVDRIETGMTEFVIQSTIAHFSLLFFESLRYLSKEDPPLHVGLSGEGPD